MLLMLMLPLLLPMMMLMLSLLLPMPLLQSMVLWTRFRAQV